MLLILFRHSDTVTGTCYGYRHSDTDSRFLPSNKNMQYATESGFGLHNLTLRGCRGNFEGFGPFSNFLSFKGTETEFISKWDRIPPEMD